MMTEYVAVFIDNEYGGLKFGQPSQIDHYAAQPSNCDLAGWLVVKSAHDSTHVEWESNSE